MKTQLGLNPIGLSPPAGATIPLPTCHAGTDQGATL